MKKHLIYALVEPGTDEVRYVGRSSLGMGRPRYHIKHARKKESDGSWASQLYVHAWVRSLKDRVPDVRVLEEFDPSDDVSDLLNQAEMRWITEFKAKGHRLTNLTEGGGGVLGHRHSDEIKSVIAEASRNQVWTEERRQRISSAITGERNSAFGKPGRFLNKRHSDETRVRLSATQLGSKRPDQSGVNHWTARTGRSPNRGRPMSEQAKAKLSESLTGRTYPNRRGQRVRELSTGIEFDQAIQAAAHFGVSKSTVSRCVRDGLERQSLRFEALD
jgi:group I intron endonuclease